MVNRRILFVCTYHGARAIIAEEFAKQYAGDRVDVFSSCFDPGKIGNLPLNIMNEIGIKIPRESPKSVFDRYADKEEFDYVISLCHEATTEQCPVFRINVDAMYKREAERILWSIQDFKSLNGTDEEKLAGARIIRDNIKTEVISFLRQIGINQNNI